MRKTEDNETQYRTLNLLLLQSFSTQVNSATDQFAKTNLKLWNIIQKLVIYFLMYIIRITCILYGKVILR